MKICWDNLEKLRLNKNGYFTYKNSYHNRMKEVDSCKSCGESFLAFTSMIDKEKGEYCSRDCSAVINGKLHKTHSEDVKMIISMKNKERFENKENHPWYGKIGEQSPNWKGGISCEPYCEIWLDKEYKESIKERDGYKCINPECHKISDKLHIHHINYNKKDCGPLNLITLCNICNMKANGNREWHQAWFTAIISKRYGRAT